MAIIKKETLTRIASLGFGIIVLVVFINFIGTNALENVLLKANPAFIALTVGLELVGFMFYATAWYVLIRATGHRIPFLTCQGITFASIFVSYIMPSGIFLEAMRCFLGSKESGMNLGESTATVILHRMLYIIGFLGSTALALPALALTGSLHSSAIYDILLLPILSIAGLIILLYLSLNPKRMQPILNRVLRFVEPLIRSVQKEAKISGRANQFLDEYHVGFRRMLSSKLHVLTSFVASLGDWACSVLILWIVLFALGFDVSLWVVVVAMAIGKMIQMTPIAGPGMLGIYEAAVTASLSLFAVPVAVAASAALLLRLVTSWLDLPITGIAAYHYGYKLMGKKNASFGSVLKS